MDKEEKGEETLSLSGLDPETLRKWKAWVDRTTEDVDDRSILDRMISPETRYRKVVVVSLLTLVFFLVVAPMSGLGLRSNIQLSRVREGDDDLEGSPIFKLVNKGLWDARHVWIEVRVYRNGQYSQEPIHWYNQSESRVDGFTSLWVENSGAQCSYGGVYTYSLEVYWDKGHELFSGSFSFSNS